jgi:RNA 3'-terminal phosphate cyclase (ATP)
MLTIDGSEGEGGGQILRSSLSLSICTQQPFRIENIRANRDKPGLMRQHLTAVKAAAEICNADVEGAELESRELTFRPRSLVARNYSFAIGTAGSCTLVLQTLLPPLMTANQSSTVRITGGTHNRGSPPFDFLERAFVPLIRRMGVQVSLQVSRYGFYPRGGGEILASIEPARELVPLHVHERGSMERAYTEAYIAALPMDIAERELRVIADKLSIPSEQRFVRALPNDMGPGNAVTITLEHANVTEVFTGFGERGLRAETLAEQAAAEAQQYLNAHVPIGEHLADQLLLPMALAGGGSFLTTSVTEHVRSNALVIARFTNRRIQVRTTPKGHLVTCD